MPYEKLLKVSTQSSSNIDINLRMNKDFQVGSSRQYTDITIMNTLTFRPWFFPSITSFFHPTGYWRRRAWVGTLVALLLSLAD